MISKKHGKVVCYADGTVLFVESNSQDGVFTRVQDELRKIQTWLRANNLFVNLGKNYILPCCIANFHQQNITKLRIHDN